MDDPRTIEEHVHAVIDWWRGANEAPGGCSPREAIDGMREHIFALSDLTGYGQQEDVRRWRLVPNEPDHFVTFDEAGWFIEHSVDCRIAGTIGTCDFNTAIREVYDEPPLPDDMGRWRITAIDEEGMPSLERAHP